jgi:hypothetical protein
MRGATVSDNTARRTVHRRAFRPVSAGAGAWRAGVGGGARRRAAGAGGAAAGGAAVTLPRQRAGAARAPRPARITYLACLMLGFRTAGDEKQEQVRAPPFRPR